MKISFSILFIFLLSYNIFAQQPLCNDAEPFCTGVTYTYPLDTGSIAETGPDYGCLCTQPNPAWYYLQIATAGYININIASTCGDVDFAAWGPFTTLTCDSTELTAVGNPGCGGNYLQAYGNMVDCAYTTAAVEDCYIPNAQVGEYYMLMITNYGNCTGDVIFSQNSGTGATDCNIVVSCNISNITVNLSCDSVTNTYDINGVIEFVAPPTTGSLIVEDNAGYFQAINPLPNFSSPTNFNITGIPLDGLNHTIYAYFTDDSTCTYELNYIAPDTCSGCTTPLGSITSTTPNCYDSPITFTYVPGTVDTGATYFWDFGTGASPTTANTIGPHIVTYSSPGITPNITLTVIDSTCISDIINTNIFIPENTIIINPIACDNYTSPSGNYTWTNSGTYLDTIPNSLGCDSIITINLSVNYSSNSTVYPTACNSYTSPSGNYTWTSSGIYLDTIPNYLGCDSTITIYLTINNFNTNDTINPIACDNYTSPSGNYTWTSSGTYLDTIPNSLGCDSIITVFLTINTVDTSVSQNGDTLFANAVGAIYQWLNCDNSYIPISGETNQSFIVTQNGNYAVVVNQNTCSDTSSCYYVNIVSIIGNSDFVVLVYPNPTTGEIIIEGKSIEFVEITNIEGQLVENKKVKANKVSVDLSQQAKGIYIIKVRTNKGVAVRKVVLE